MAYASWSVVFGEQPSAAKWNILGTNDAYFNTQVGSLFGAGTTSTVWWEEVGRTTLSVAGDTISVTGIPLRKYLKVMASYIASGNLNSVLRLNNDSGSNYARRSSSNGGADATATSATGIYNETTSVTGNIILVELDVINIATSEKVASGHSVSRGTSGAANAPNRQEIAGKWANTSDQISRVDLINSDTGDFAIGSEIVVLGHD